jgi:hypothetical protein
MAQVLAKYNQEGRKGFRIPDTGKRKDGGRIDRGCGEFEYRSSKAERAANSKSEIRNKFE